MAFAENLPGSELNTVDTLDNDHIVPLWTYKGSAVAPIHGLHHLLHGLEA